MKGVREARKLRRVLPELVSGKFWVGRYGKAAALGGHFFPAKKGPLSCCGMLFLKLGTSGQSSVETNLV